MDDEPAIRLLCRVDLELEGREVVEAAAIDEAGARLAARPVDVMLLDVHVGTGNGLELLREARIEHPELPVALLTGSSGAGTVEHTGADALVPKPFRIEELSGTVARLAADGR